MFVVSLSNLVDYVVGDTQQQWTLIELQLVLHSILSARIILNLRKLVVASVDEGPKNLTTIIFGELVSNSSSSTGYGTQQTQEEDVELQDLCTGRNCASS